MRACLWRPRRGTGGTGLTLLEETTPEDAVSEEAELVVVVAEDVELSLGWGEGSRIVRVVVATGAPININIRSVDKAVLRLLPPRPRQT
jgi:hypothetical protein